MLATILARLAPALSLRNRHMRMQVAMCRNRNRTAADAIGGKQSRQALKQHLLVPHALCGGGTACASSHPLTHAAGLASAPAAAVLQLPPLGASTTNVIRIQTVCFTYFNITGWVDA